MDRTKIIPILRKEYPDAECSLNYRDPFELAISLILAAQCTDNMVNKVTPALFEKYPTIEAFAGSDKDELELSIKSTGFYRNKAKSITELSRKLLTDFNGKVPNTMEQLVTLPGIGRKSANIILTDAFGKIEGIAVDTHVKRLSKRIGFTDNEDPNKVEKDLLNTIPKKDWKDFNHLLVFHGRAVCKAQRPDCENCSISHLCRFYSKV